MNSKRFTGVEIKDADKGHVTAVFSTFDVIDKDGDVTVKGAIKDGTPVVISAYNHTSWGGSLPVGKGRVRVVGDEAHLEGQFFLDTAHGRDTFATVKALAEDGLGEWSYGFDVVDAEHSERDGKSVRVLKELKVHEVSPVMLGAGVDTRTMSVKSSMRFTEHAEAVLADLESLRSRTAEVMAKRAEKGKSLGEESAALVKQIRDQLAQLDAMLTPAGESGDDTTTDDVQREFLRSIALDL